jgi:hypothetical protein
VAGAADVAVHLVVIRQTPERVRDALVAAVSSALGNTTADAGASMTARGESQA